MEILIQPANSEDLKRLTDIYNHYIIHSHVTFDTEVFSLLKREPWFKKFSDQGPYKLFVAKKDDFVVGYAASSQLRSKSAYFTSVETTVYVDPLYLGQGIGFKLYYILIQALEREPLIHKAFAGIALPNEDSAILHGRLGFQLIGIFHEVGYKFGRYWDVAWYERDLSIETLSDID
jgi:phosphinothricin acetyltransferase